MANPDIARLEGLAREGRVPITRMLTHAGSGHPGGLLSEGVSAEVVNVATVKPLDEEGIVGSAVKTGRVVTVELHSIHGGLGSAVAELPGKLLPTPLSITRNILKFLPR